MALIDLERDVLSVCFRPEPPAEALARLGDRKVWLLYRELARDRLLREINLALPRSCALLQPAELGRLFDRHLERDPPRTRYFHAIVLAFARSVDRSLREAAAVPPGLLDLLRYEAAVWEVSDLDARLAEAPSEFSFDRVAVLSPALRLLEASHAVHAPEADLPYGKPGRVYLAVHRAEDRLRPQTWTFNRTSYALLREFARADQTVSESVAKVAKRLRKKVDQAFVDGLCESLAQWIELGIVVGTRSQ